MGRLRKLFDRLFLPAETRELQRQNEILEQFNELAEEDIYEASRFLLANTDDSWGGMTPVLRKVAKQKLADSSKEVVDVPR